MRRRSRPDLLLATARLALCSAFVVSALQKLDDPAAAAAEVRELTGIKHAEALSTAVVLTQVGGSALLLSGGRGARLGAIVLSGFTLAATLAAHAFWTRSGVERARSATTFFEHMGLIGGLLLAGWTASGRRERNDGAR